MKPKPIQNHFKRNAKTYQRLFDVFVVIISYFLAFFLTNLTNDNYFSFTVEYFYMSLLIVPTWMLLIKSTNMSQIPRSRTYLSIFFKILNLNLLGFVILLVFKYVFGFETFSQYFLISFTIVNTILLFTARIVSFKILKIYRNSGHNIHNLVIIADERSEEIIDSILSHFEWGYRIIAIISDSEHIRQTYAPLIRVLPERSNISTLLKIDIIDEVLYCKHDVDLEQVDKHFGICQELGITFKMKSKIVPVEYGKGQLTHINKTSFLTYFNTPNNSLSWTWKSISDLIISATLIFLLSPIFITVAAIIWLTSKGPVIFKQKRVGVHGRQFYIYKFRTMVQNAEELKAKLMEQNESDGPAFKIKHDPRITTIGRFLRKTSIDELPQLFNILKGDMSLIGPRPPLPSEVEEYEAWQLRRLSVKPGITCTWQIIPNRNDVVFEKWMKLDMKYIDDWSLKSDWQLFFKTIKSVLINKGC